MRFLEASELKLSHITDCMNLGTWQWNVETGETIFNERWAQIVGYSLADFGDTTIDTWLNLVHPDDLEKSNLGLKKMFSGQTERYSSECRMKHKDGHWVWVEDKGKVITWTEDGKPLLVFGTHTDITERKTTQEKLKETTIQMEQFFALNLDMFCIIDTDFNILRVNWEWKNIFGYGAEEIKGHNISDYLHPDDVKRTTDMLKSLTLQKPRQNFINRYRCKSGEYKDVEWRYFTNGQLFYGSARDITERLKSERKLKEVEESRQILLDNIPTQVWYLTSPHTFGAVNKPLAEFYGMTVEDMSFADLYSLYSDEMVEVCIKTNSVAFEKGERTVSEEWLTDKDGVMKLYSITKTPKFNQNGDVEYLVCAGNDITQQREMELALSRSEDKFRSLFDDSPIGLFIYDADTFELLEANKKAFELCEASNLEEIATWERFKMEGYTMHEAISWLRLAANSGQQSFEWKSERKNGTVQWLHMNMSRITLNDVSRLLVSSTDITARKVAEEENKRFRRKIDMANLRRSIMLQVSSRFIISGLSELDDAINDTLEIIGKSMGADRVYVFRNYWDKQISNNTHEWCNDGIEPQIENLQNQPISYLNDWIPVHIRGKAAIHDDVATITPLDSSFRKMLLSQGIKSIITVPMVENDNLFGFVGFDYVKNYHKCTEEEETLLLEYANGLLTTLMRLDSYIKVRNSEERFRRLFSEVSSVAVSGYNENREIIHWNKASEQLYGYTASEAIGHRIFEEKISKPTKDEIENSLSKDFHHVTPENGTSVEFRRKKSGVVIPVLSSTVMLDLSCQAKELYRVEIDMSGQKSLEHKLQQEKELFQKTLISIGDGVISTDDKACVKIMNGVAERLTGWTQEKAVGLPLEQVFKIINAKTREYLKNPALLALASTEIINLDDDTILIAKDGREIFIDDSAAQIRDEKGNVTGAVIVFRDATERREKQREIEFLSFHDYLTGMYNRRYIETVLKDLDNENNYPLMLVYIDINGLKLTNDAFGHTAGDELLKAVAKILNNTTRKTDIAGRVGGDEFLIIMPKTDEETAERLKIRINKACSCVTVNSAIVSVAVGYAAKSAPDQDIETIKINAENLMYKDKMKHGKAMRMQTIDAVLHNINKKFDKEYIHMERVAKLSELTARKMGLSEKEIREVRMAATFHDIGKIAFEPAMLYKPGKLSEVEYEALKKHTEIGYQILKSVDEYSILAEAILFHHERWDGTGYPNGLMGDQIPLSSTIIFVADAFEAMTGDRTYQRPRSTEDAIMELIKCSGTQFSPRAVKAIIAALNEHTNL